MRATINTLFLGAYALRIAQAHHRGSTVVDLLPYVGAWVSWLAISRLRLVEAAP